MATDSAQRSSKQLFRILSLDGGGAKGFYTLGVLKGIEGMLGCRIHERFDLIYGTSTGAIIAMLLALGFSVDEILGLYRKHVVAVVAKWFPWQKTAALNRLATEIFGEQKIENIKTGIGIVCTNYDSERPLIFKAHERQAFGDKGTFVPFFGVSLADAVAASCSAYPFFSRRKVRTSEGDTIATIDGGYCANNPTLYAIAEATDAMRVSSEAIRVVSIGVGEYPTPTRSLLSPMRYAKYIFFARLLQKSLEINTQSMDQLRRLLFKDIESVRISKAYTEPEMATDLFEHDLQKLDLLWRRGRESFRDFEQTLTGYLK